MIPYGFDLFLLDLTLLSGLPSNWIILGWGILDVARLKYFLVDLKQLHLWQSIILFFLTSYDIVLGRICNWI